ncbi:BPSL0067 family protein [Muricoccus aerilatus]|uniref:BPSL0067 family protein n=1 Tax=Muricoccus aerilatus TaxID=452982 RepID=UPI000693B213|nr:BPSL0067 family protein [Roseomonas aerilata]
MNAVRPVAGPAPQVGAAPVSRGGGFSVPNLPPALAGASPALELLAMESLLKLQEGFNSGAAKPRAAEASPGALPAAASRFPKAFMASDYGKYIGRSTGSGQCVALVQAAKPEVGKTAGWTRGEAVRGNTSLQPGTIIATFNSTGRYTNAEDGSSHAAIYLGQDESGIQVLDQWVGKPAAIRTIAWARPGASPSNTGERFHVVGHAT